MPERPDLEDALQRVVAVLTRLNLDYTVVGGVAVIAHGYRRATFDVDALVLGVDGRKEELLATLAQEGVHPRDVPLAPAAVNLVLHLQTEGGTDVDLLLGFLPLEAEIVSQSVSFEFANGLRVPIARPEDLIILKLLARRKKDDIDIVELYRIWPEIDVHRIRRIVGDYAALLDAPSMIEKMDELLKP